MTIKRLLLKAVFLLIFISCSTFALGSESNRLSDFERVVAIDVYEEYIRIITVNIQSGSNDIKADLYEIPAGGLSILKPLNVLFCSEKSEYVDKYMQEIIKKTDIKNDLSKLFDEKELYYGAIIFYKIGRKDFKNKLVYEENDRIYGFEETNSFIKDCLERFKIPFCTTKDYKERVRLSINILKELLNNKKLGHFHPVFVEGLASLGEWDEKYLREKDPKIRLALISSISEYRPIFSIKYLEESLQDDDREVLVSSLMALGNFTKDAVSDKLIKKVKSIAKEHWMDKEAGEFSKALNYPIRESALSTLNSWGIISQEENKRLKDADAILDW